MEKKVLSSRYEPNAVWIEKSTGEALTLVERLEDGRLVFQGKANPYEEKEVAWSPKF